MNKFSYYLSAASVALSMNVQAANFWFPVVGHFPNSANKITAVPDMDTRSKYMKSRLKETGSTYTSGCDFDQYGLRICAKDGGGLWKFNDHQTTFLNQTYLFYDNHRGYDFALPTGSTVWAVENGYFCGYNAGYGQICVMHWVAEGQYRTHYTHLDSIPSKFTTMAEWTYIPKETILGLISNMGVITPGVKSGGVHLHFTVQKYEPSHPDYATRKVIYSDGTSDGWIVVDPYGIRNGDNGYYVEPRLWN